MNKPIYIYSLIIIISISNASAQEFEPIDFLRLLSEVAHSNERTQKLITLDYIEEILNRSELNNIELESHLIYLIYNILEYLVFEGTVNISTNENIQNNFPDVRLKAVILLGRLNIIEARNAIIEVLRCENIPLIINEANKILYKN